MIDLQRLFYSPFILKKLEIEIYNRNRALKSINSQNTAFSLGLSNKILAISQLLQTNPDNSEIYFNLLTNLSLIGTDAKQYVLLENQDMRINFAEVNIADLLNKLLLEYQDIFLKKNIRIITSITDNIPIECDEGLLTTGLQRIIGDALDSSPNSIEVVAKLENIQNLRLEFKYSRKNINTKILYNLFEPFVVNQDLFSNGLGLAMSKAIIDAHNVKILAEKIVQDELKILLSIPLKKIV